MTEATMTGERLRIEARHLTKRFGDITAVDDLGFTVEPGRVTGFLGPNGSGKTTTMRMMIGHITPTSGSVTIGGKRYREFTDPSAAVGAVFDAASFHPDHSARDHLRVYAAMGGHPDERVDELLSLMDLTGAARRRTRGFSTGMRQRLNLATALLGDPRVLLLDEPSNGLDPAGTAWLRSFLRHLAGEGRTVLISSHVLGEIQQVADDVVVIRQGRLVTAAPLSELSGMEAAVLIRSPDAEALVQVFTRQPPAGPEPRVERIGPDQLRVWGPDAAHLADLAAAHRLRIHGLTTEEPDLERLFLDLTGSTR